MKKARRVYRLRAFGVVLWNQTYGWARAILNFAANVFDALREMESAGERFDTIILDPPAFAKNRATVKSAARGYKEINLRALKLLKVGGVLVTCSCSYHMSEELFLDIIADAALDARRRVQIIERRGQSTDHPVLLGRAGDALFEVCDCAGG